MWAALYPYGHLARPLAEWGMARMKIVLEMPSDSALATAAAAASDLGGLLQSIAEYQRSDKSLFHEFYHPYINVFLTVALQYPDSPPLRKAFVTGRTPCTFMRDWPDGTVQPLVAYLVRVSRLTDESLRRGLENAMDFWSEAISPDIGEVREGALRLFRNCAAGDFEGTRDALLAEIEVLTAAVDLFGLEAVMRFSAELVAVRDEGAIEDDAVTEASLRLMKLGAVRDEFPIDIGWRYLLSMLLQQTPSLADAAINAARECISAGGEDEHARLRITIACTLILKLGEINALPIDLAEILLGMRDVYLKTQFVEIIIHLARRGVWIEAKYTDAATREMFEMLDDFDELEKTDRSNDRFIWAT
jgi:hypothetical protein